MRGIPKGFSISSPVFGSCALPRVCQKAIVFLDKHGFTKLLSSRDLTARLGISITYFSHHANHPALSEYRGRLDSGVTVWGSKKTIKALNKINAENK